MDHACNKLKSILHSAIYIILTKRAESSDFQLTGNFSGNDSVLASLQFGRALRIMDSKVTHKKQGLIF